MGLSKAEQETIIRRAEDEDGWDIYTASPSFTRRLRKVAQAVGVEVTEVDGYGLRVILPRKCVKLSIPRKPTEAQMAHLRKMREKAAKP